MCRLILATGTFDPNEIVAGAVAMAAGQTANHESSIRNHPDGWGGIWSDQRSATGLSVMRDARTAGASALDSGLGSIETNFLAIHVRSASYPTTRGLEYTHPLERPVDGWYFMHNGSLPTVYQKLGLERSTFDSAEYFDYLVPTGAVRLDLQATRDRLMRIPAGGNSANAFAMCQDRAYVINWQTNPDLWPQYFTMHQLIEPARRIVSSEIIPAIAPARYWQAVPPGTLMELRF